MFSASKRLPTILFYIRPESMEFILHVVMHALSEEFRVFTLFRRGDIGRKNPHGESVHEVSKELLGPLGLGQLFLVPVRRFSERHRGRIPLASVHEDDRAHGDSRNECSSFETSHSVPAARQPFWEYEQRPLAWLPAPAVLLNCLLRLLPRSLRLSIDKNNIHLLHDLANDGEVASLLHCHDLRSAKTGRKNEPVHVAHMVRDDHGRGPGVLHVRHLIDGTLGQCRVELPQLSLLFCRVHLYVLDFGKDAIGHHPRLQASSETKTIHRLLADASLFSSLAHRKAT
mmetsp:Transcript_20301/g.54219  ORF Transcript_20301/g.54219 Transcript_20301/m.54219 type:complete len:285 (+) Transcript_20301:427-1281(+)